MDDRNGFTRGHNGKVLVPVKVWLVRHAASVISGSGRWQGWLDVELSELGRQQANERRLKRDLPITDRVFTSPVKRCIETCDIMLPDARMVCDDRLLTRNLGSWEGLTTEEIHRQGGDWRSPFVEEAPPGGESLSTVWQRVQSFMEDLSGFSGEHIVVTHGAIIGLILLRLNVEPVIIPFCSFVILESQDNNNVWTIEQGPSGSVSPV